jgi:DNA polymerase-3 subunit alpha
MGFDSNLIPSEAFDNTIKLANRIEDYGLAFKKGYFEVPLFRDSDGRAWTAEESHKKLEDMSWQGLMKKGKFADSQYRDRLARELEVLRDKNYSSYFLIISDIIKFMEKEGILKPVGRGSSVGSLVCYATEITTPDPIRWKVPFERFINDGRQDLPDIDTDISKESRHQVLDFIRDTYGEARVAQIATFQTLAAKAVLDNVGRVLGVPSSIRYELSKIMGDVTGSKLIDPEDGEELCKPGSEARILIDQTDGWWEIACALEDTPKNVGYHAAGVVISNEDIDEYTSLMADHEGYRSVQIDMVDIETLGLLKLDMLGLRTLDIIDQSIKLVKQHHGKDIDIYTMENNPNDRKTYELISQGNYVSIFQVDSPGYYIKRRHGQESLDVWHPELEEVFALSYNLCLYQEQVMALAKILSGFTDVEADKLRKGIGKKNKEIVKEALNLLIVKGIEKGRDKE